MMVEAVCNLCPRMPSSMGARAAGVLGLSSGLRMMFFLTQGGGLPLEMSREVGSGFLCTTGVFLPNQE